MKKISIITISYNEVKTIEKTILSCINQTYLNQEYIIIDGASNDGTIEIINKYNDKIDVFISEPDKGLYDAMNKGLSLATGDYVIFINGGDSLFNKHTLSSIFEEVKTKEPDFIYGDAVVKQHNSNEVNYKKARNHKYSWYGMFTNHQAMIYSLKIIKENYLSYDQHNYPISADYKFTIEFLSKTSNIQYINNWICLFNLDGVSSINKKQGLAEANKIRKEILNYSSVKIWLIEKLITSSHYLAKNLKPIYNLIRFQSLKVQ